MLSKLLGPVSTLFKTSVKTLLYCGFVILALKVCFVGGCFCFFSPQVIQLLLRVCHWNEER